MIKTESLPTTGASEQSRPEQLQPKPREISPAVRSWIENVIAPALVKAYLQEQAIKAKLPEEEAQAEEADESAKCSGFRRARAGAKPGPGPCKSSGTVTGL